MEEHMELMANLVRNSPLRLAYRKLSSVRVGDCVAIKIWEHEKCWEEKLLVLCVEKQVLEEKLQMKKDVTAAIFAPLHF
ncbi:hypothetical protein RIF29_08188 [Crotalaria pallida]|uniref:Uncharacterized protein n=1 Tax=Crotalaria pallida TaxID=3830 RepID=A0AAN9J606_CROPI